MSAPWPPAFMRTAPPIEPGTPTAHSKPVSPAATVRRATTGSALAPPARTARAVDVDLGEAIAQHDGQAGEAAVGHEQVRALADDQNGHARGDDGVAGGRQVVDRRRLEQQRGGTARPGRWCAARAARRAADARPRPAGAGPRHASRGRAGVTISCGSSSVEDLVGPRRDVAGAGREAQVAGAQLARQPGDDIGLGGQPRHALPGVGLERRVDQELAGHPGDGLLVGRVDVGEHHHVGVAEGRPEVAPQGGRPGVALRLEHHDDAAPPAGARPRRARRPPCRGCGRSRRRR